ncbi:metallophosphoesterase family protein [Halomonas halocynthiae]|uniref:metallophosphoesterase family protein n=1 Tax=Halomonas halocynthiae TaxID=176290 RepID=UPI0004238712|nr:DNA repair exonuclease [Halomonas halocynthiae]
MLRFLHTADWQIGRQYSRFDPDDAAMLADARYVAVQRLARLAGEEQVAAVLVAGDIFDAQTLSDRTLHRTFQAMSAFSGPWVMLPGNHDAALAESIWTRAERIGAMPANVHLLTTPEVFVLEDAGAAILPAPLTQRQTHHDLSVWFDNAETHKGAIRIGLAHGSVEGQLPESADSPNPIAADRATTAKLDYLALGDWHGLKRINARTWYSGTPEQERFKDNGAGQALLVEIDSPGDEPRVTPCEIGQHRWYQWQRQIHVASDLDALLTELAALPAMSVIDLTLSGELDLAGQQCLEQALGAAAGRHRSLQTHLGGLALVPTAEDIAALQADGYVGNVISELQQQQQGGDAQADTARQALGILARLLGDQRSAADAPESQS